MTTKAYTLVITVDDQQNIDVRVLPAWSVAADVDPARGSTPSPPIIAGFQEDADFASGPHVFLGDDPDDDEPRPHVRTPDPRGDR